MELPDAMIDTQCENMINQFAQQMAQQGLSMDQYLQFSGLTLDQLKEQVRPDAITRIKSSLVLEQIAKEENIEITDADVDAEIEKMATMYNMEADKLILLPPKHEKQTGLAGTICFRIFTLSCRISDSCCSLRIIQLLLSQLLLLSLFLFLLLHEVLQTQ